MNRLLSLSLSALLLVGCGTQDYPSPSVDDAGQFPTQQNGADNSNTTASAFHTQPLSTGYFWRGLPLIGFAQDYVGRLRCQYQDPKGTRSLDAFGEALATGMIAGMVFSASRDGSDNVPHDDHGGHSSQGPSLSSTVRRVLAAGVQGGIFVGACQTALAGGNWTSFSGILGQDFAGLSSSLVAGGSSFAALRPWVHRFFRSDTPSTGGKAILFRIMPDASVLIFSTGVGFLVYHQLTGNWSPDATGAPVTCAPSR